MISTRTMLWFWREYLPSYQDSTNPRAAPLEADVSACTGLAPATLVTAEFDPLRDEGIAYIEKLKAAGVAVKHKHFTGTVHGFWAMDFLGSGGAALKFTIDELTSALHGCANP